MMIIYNTLELKRKFYDGLNEFGILSYKDLNLYTLERACVLNDHVPDGTYQVKLETINQIRHIYIENPLLIEDKAEIVFERNPEKELEILIGEQAILNYNKDMQITDSKKAFALLWRRLYTNCVKKGIDIVLQVNSRY